MSYPFAEVQSVYSTAPVDWAIKSFDGKLKKRIVHDKSPSNEDDLLTDIRETTLIKNGFKLMKSKPERIKTLAEAAKY